LLRQKGFGVTVVPATTRAEEILKQNPDGVFLSNGRAIRQRFPTRTKPSAI
jgi:carbamoylphosphate synthase small subunit